MLLVIFATFVASPTSTAGRAGGQSVAARAEKNAKTSETSDEIPLEPLEKPRPADAFDIGHHPATQPTIEREPAVSQEPMQESHVLIALKFTCAFGVGRAAESAGGAAVELAYRFPFAGGLIGVATQPAIVLGWGQRQLVEASTRSQAVRLQLPLLVSSNIAVNQVHLLRAAAGPSVDFYWLSTRAGAMSTADQGAGLGFTAWLGYVYRFGTGGVGGELRYHLGPESLRGQSALASTIGVAATYAFFL